MKRSRILSAIFFGLVTVSLILVSCQSKGRTMTIVMVEGQPEIQKKGTGVWKPVGVGVVVKPGDYFVPALVNIYGWKSMMDRFLALDVKPKPGWRPCLFPTPIRSH